VAEPLSAIRDVADLTMWKFIGALLLVLALLLIGGDAWMRSLAEDRSADRLEKSLKLRGTVHVSIGGWPFVVKAIGGSFPAVEITAEHLISQGLELRRVEVDLESVELSLSNILAGGDEAVRARSGQGQGVVTSDALSDIVSSRFPGVSVSIRAGRVLLQGAGTSPTVVADLALKKRALLIGATALHRPLKIRLPRFASGLTYESLEVTGGEVIIRFTLENAHLVSRD
jgi:hypothetical protein